MIPGYELRPGNYVLVGQNMEQVFLINDTSAAIISLSGRIAGNTEINKQQRLDELQPVLLTDVVLSQWNFVYQDHFKFWQRLSGTDENRPEMDIDGNDNLLDLVRRTAVKKRNLLHQLQNIYCLLMGKERLFRHEPWRLAIGLKSCDGPAKKSSCFACRP